MKTQQVYLEYISELNVFAVKDEIIESLERQNIVPLISLNPADYARLQTPAPLPRSPLVGFLCCREQNMYSADFNYVKSLATANVRLRFLTYKNNMAQMQNIHGLMLPGGRFPSPPEFYIDAAPDLPPAGLRSDAYISCITEAEKRGLPMFGVCAGAQMIGCMHGFKLYRNVKQALPTDLEHKTIELEAHTIKIKPHTLLHKLLGTDKAVVNSRHIEAIVNTPSASNLHIYAYAPDNVPESWGNAKKHILCIQWHPEDFAAAGSRQMQNLYNWLAAEATAFQHKK